MKKNGFSAIVLIVVSIAMLLVGCIQPLDFRSYIGDDDSAVLIKGTYPQWIAGTVDPNVGDRFEHLNHLFQAVQDPGPWETPPLGGNWFWEDLGELQNGDVTPTPTATTVSATPTATTVATATPTPTVTAVTTPTPTSTVTAVQPLPPNDFPENVFAPYIDISKHGQHKISEVYQLTGQKYFVLSFIVSNQQTGAPIWLMYDENNNNSLPGGAAMDSEFANVTIMNEINAIRAAGGEIIVSFGGAEGIEIGSNTNYSTAAEIQAAYQSVIDKYKLTWIDMNLENAAGIGNMPMRMDALKGLQVANPGLKISFQFLSNPEVGLTYFEPIILAKERNMDIHSVSLMTMHFGSYYNYETMGQFSIDAITNARAQLDAEGLYSTKIGICPMIGTNEKDNVFYLSCADKVNDFLAITPWVNWVSFWSISRDNGGCYDLVNAAFDCSGIAQTNWAFTNKFKNFTGAAPTPTPTPIVTPSPTPDPSQPPLWEMNKFYNTNDLVTYNGSVYKCLISHTSTVVNTPQVGALWQVQ